MTLSRTDLAAIYRACRLIEKYDLAMAIHKCGWPFWYKCAEFYGIEWGDWSDHYKTRQNERILALLFFAAAGGEL